MYVDKWRNSVFHGEYCDLLRELLDRERLAQLMGMKRRETQWQPGTAPGWFRETERVAPRNLRYSLRPPVFAGPCPWWISTVRRSRR